MPVSSEAPSVAFWFLACVLLLVVALAGYGAGRLQQRALQRQALGARGVAGVARPAGEARLKEFDFKTPEQRYRRFIDEEPALAARIPQKDLALYLGITPVALSRIRGRLQRTRT